MKIKTSLSPASQRPSVRHFEQTVFPLAMSKWGSFSSVFLRFALGLSFLSAVADRFGLWGQFGQPNVAWGTFSRFVEYIGRLNSYLPPRMTLTLAVISTAPAFRLRSGFPRSSQPPPADCKWSSEHQISMNAGPKERT